MKKEDQRGSILFELIGVILLLSSFFAILFLLRGWLEGGKTLYESFENDRRIIISKE